MFFFYRFNFPRNLTRCPLGDFGMIFKTQFFKFKHKSKFWVRVWQRAINFVCVYTD
jgi:hypothetical protein